MHLENRLRAFAQLGDLLKSSYGKQLTEEWAFKAQAKNRWFDTESTLRAVESIANDYLQRKPLEKWLASYTLPESTARNVGVIMAGNIPLVGFHDALAVLMSGHNLMAKLSSQDDYLLKEVFKQLFIIEPGFEKRVQYVERLNHVDALIATGSDNTAQHFNYYFKDKPRIIRGNRSSVAIINGAETNETWKKLGNDILQYYGMGCRNISKLLVLGKFAPEKLYENIIEWAKVVDNIKYQHNYDYNRSIYLLNSELHFDNGFLVCKPSEQLVSPLSVLFYQEFDDVAAIKTYLEANESKIQCVVSENAWYAGSLPIGTTQQPGLSDYADGIDTMAFLSKL